MTGSEDSSRLSRISTRWEELLVAQQGEGAAASAAQKSILCRYCGAIYRYLLSMVRDPNTAEELSQEFALRFVRQDFKSLRPERGRFRDFVKRALANQVTDYYRRQRLSTDVQPYALTGLAAPDSMDDSDAEFVRQWRGELLARVWEALASEEAATGKLYHTILHWRVQHPREPALRLAEDLQAKLGRPFTDGGIRVTLHRARERFADLLLDEVARSLQTADIGRMEQELIDLDLLTYCRSALERRTQT